MNRIDRLMAMILLLQGRRLLRAEEIAEHFEISARTVYRDIAALCEAGVPVVAEAGVGYSLLRDYRLPPVMFTPEEAGALFMGRELVGQLTDLSLQAPMESALMKIRAVLPRSHQDRLDRLEHSTALMIRSRASLEGGNRTVLARIQSALAARRVLHLTYRKDGETSTSRRAVEPLGLVYYAEHWHLIAHCRLRGDIRDFRSDRIVDLELGEEGFEGHPDFSLRNHVEAWATHGRAEEVVVRVDRRAAARFRRAWFGATVSEADLGDSVRFAVMTDGGDWLKGWLLGFGTSLEVESPDSLRQGVARLAGEVAARYVSRG